MAFKIKKVRPLFTGIITTAITYKGEVKTAGGIILDTRKLDGTLNEYQTVVAVGTTVHDVKAGDIVKITYKRYYETQHLPGDIDKASNKQSDNLSVNISVPMVVIDGVEYLFIQNNDIEYVVEEYEVDEGGLLQ